MDDVYVLDKNLNLIGVVDSYKSLIWANRYVELGDCELYVTATTEMINLLQKDYYLARLDDDMVCQIKKIELDTDAENGNYLIVNGYDVRRFLDQRVIWSTMTCDGLVEAFVRQMVQNTVCTPALSARQLRLQNGNQMFFLGDQAGFSEVTTEQVSYKNVGEKIREYCTRYGWGYKVVLGNNKLWFVLYKGTDRTDSVIFSTAYENLSTSKYVEDETNLGNVALVAGSGEGSLRSRNVSGYAEGVDRFEIYVDAKDISKDITWGDLTKQYPTTDSGGQGYISGTAETGYVYKMNYINIHIVDADQLTNLQVTYPDGTLIMISGEQYYQIYNEVIADIPSNTPQEGDTVTLRDVVYSVYLLNRGYEKLAEYGGVVSFEGTVIPDVTFVYKRDYFLGDVVSVENEYGIKVSARIVEVIEVNDDSGYSMEPKFEYIYSDSSSVSNLYILTEDSDNLADENGDPLITE